MEAVQPMAVVAMIVMVLAEMAVAAELVELALRRRQAELVEE